MKLGETYQPNVQGAHVWVVITEPNADGAVVIVSFTSHEDNKDQSCIIDVGEHSSVIHKTVIDYGRARICIPEHQQRFKDNATQRDSASPALLRKIIDGALKSDRMAQKIQALVK